MHCWGNNDFGQLGDGTFIWATLPVNVQGLSEGEVAMAAGHSHTCALNAAGKLKCWGYASHGQLGDGVASRYPFPVVVLGFEGQGDTSLLLPMIYR